MSALQGSDEFVVTDDSTSDNVSKKITLETLAAHMTGADLNATAEGIIDIAANVIGTDELSNSIEERLCPDPSGGSSGQVCARNTAGDSYELITPSGGGGGTSVDSVDVQYVTNTRAVFVDVQQADGNDFSDSANLPLGTTILPGLMETATNAEATAGTATDKALTPSNLLTIFGSVVSDTDVNVASPSSESTLIAASRQAVAEAISDHRARTFGTGNPAAIDSVADPGSGTHVSHANHVHPALTDNTLNFTDSGVLEVSITDVIEHLTEHVRYYTSDSADHDTDGSAAGQVYTTSRYPKNIHRIKAEVRPNTGSIYRAGVYTVNDDNDITAILGQSEDSEEYPANQTVTVSFDLSPDGSTDLGIPLEGSERIAILIRRVGAGNTADTRLRKGGESSNSPNESYPDAEDDFVLVNHVVYEHEDPAVGNDTHSHGTSIRGNINIYYSVTIDHGSLVGDGNVHPDHIDSGSAFGDYALFADGSGASSFEPISITDIEVIGNTWNDLLDGLGATHNIGEALDIIDDIGDNLCPNPSTGTSGQVCARNAAGDAYELVDAGTGGGGGSGGGGYGDWGDIGSVTGAISGNPVTVALDYWRGHRRLRRTLYPY